MARSSYIEVGWEQVEPDGSPCEVCGDLCLLAMVKPYYKLNDSSRKHFDEYPLCLACHEFVNDPDDAGEEWKKT